jgi:hypothetical protein
MMASVRSTNMARIVLRIMRDHHFRSKAEANTFAFNYLASAVKSGTWTKENLIAAANALETGIGEVK